MKRMIERFFKDESGLGTVELVLLILILVGLALAFKDAIRKFFGELVKGLDANHALKGTGFKKE